MQQSSKTLLREKNMSTVSETVSGTIQGLVEAGLLTITGKSGGSQTVEIAGPTPLARALGSDFSPSRNYQVNGQPADAETLVNPGDRVFVTTPVSAG